MSAFIARDLKVDADRSSTALLQYVDAVPEESANRRFEPDEERDGSGEDETLKATKG